MSITSTGPISRPWWNASVWEGRRRARRPGRSAARSRWPAGPPCSDSPDRADWPAPISTRAGSRRSPDAVPRIMDDAMTLGGRARRVLIGLLLLLSATLVTAVALPRLVDVNQYSPLIEAKVREATGRSVRLGTLGFSLLPRPSIAAGRLAISDSDRYPGRDALVVESLSIRLGLLGLLRGRVSLDSVVLSRPTLTLIRDARGRWNFDDLLARVAAAGGPGAQSGPAPPGQPSAGSPLVSIDRAAIRSGRILIYDDAVVPGSRAQAILAPVDAAVSGWGGGSEPRLDLVVGLGGSSLR